METPAGSGEMMGDVDYSALPVAPYPDMETWTPAQWGTETRVAHLESLPTYGFDSEQRQSLISTIALVGLPVNNHASLHLRPNDYHGDSKDYLGSWGFGMENYGEFSLYKRLDFESAGAMVAVTSHEGMHAVTPLEPHNAHLYDGEAERQEAAVHAWAVTDQSLATGVHLNGYHKWLMDKHAAGELNKFMLVEETFAIMGELALTDRTGLQEAQERQHRALVDANRLRGLQGQPVLEAVNLLSAEALGSTAEGIDRALVQLIDGVDDAEGLRGHVHKLKASLDPDQDLSTVEHRELVKGYVSAEAFVIPAFITYLEAIHHDEELDELKKRLGQTAVLN